MKYTTKFRRYLATAALCAGATLGFGSGVLRADAAWLYVADASGTDNAWDYYYIYTLGDKAGQSTRNQQVNKMKMDRKHSKDASTAKKARFEGTVDGFRRVNLRTRDGKSEQHSFVKVRLKNNESRVISLGTRLDPAKLDLGKGDRIRVSGDIGKVDGRNVLIADRIKTSNREVFRIKDRNQPPAGMASRAAVDGKLRGFRKVSLGGARDQNLLVRLQLRDGRSRIVDLGKNTNLSDLNLDQGDRVKVMGERRSINGRPVIVAKSIRVEGEKTRVRGRSQQGDLQASRAGW